MNIRAVFLDLEGCVTPASGGTVAWELWQMERLRIQMDRFKPGLRVCLCTGRQAPYVEAVIQALGLLHELPHIVENGAILYYANTKAWETSPLLDGAKLDALLRIRPFLVEWTRDLGGQVELGKEFSLSLNPPPSVTIEAFFRDVVDIISDCEYGPDILHLAHSKSAVDITPAGVNKGSAIAHWIELVGHPADQLAAIGDTPGDFPALETVGMPMCPANATKEVKALVLERGGYVSGLTETLGTLDCLMRL